MSATSNLNSFLSIIDSKLAACDPTDYKQFLSLVKLRADAYNALGLNGGTISGGTFEVGLTQTQATAAIDGSIDIETIKTTLGTIATAINTLQNYTDQIETKLDNVNGSVSNLGDLLTGSNTKLDTTNSNLTTINSNIDGIEGFTDGIETLLTTVNTNLSTINTNIDGLEGSVDGLEGLVNTTNTLITTLNGYVDGIEGLFNTSNTTTNNVDTKLTTLLSYIDGVETLLNTVNTNLTTLITNNANLYPITSLYTAMATGSAFGVVKSSPGRIYSLSCTNMTTLVRWFMLFNRTTNPTVGETPFRTPYPVFGNNNFLVLDSDYFCKQGNTFSNGIAWGLSTSPTNFQPSDGTLYMTEISYV